MKIEEQVISLEQAKRLHELGVKLPSLYYWYELNLNGHRSFEILPKSNWRYGVWEENESVCSALEEKATNRVYPAYTVAELGMLLPSEVYTRYTGSSPFKNAPWEWVWDDEMKAMGIFDTEAQARAAMLIYLLENKHITSEQLNTRW